MELEQRDYGQFHSIALINFHYCIMKLKFEYVLIKYLIYCSDFIWFLLGVIQNPSNQVDALIPKYAQY